MALIKCPECEKEISDKAAACPHCGCPASDFPKNDITENINNSDTSYIEPLEEVIENNTPKNIKKKYILIFTIIILLLISAVLIIIITPESNVTDRKMTINFSFGTITGNYTGEVNDKSIPNGNGVFISNNSDGENWSYEGEWKDGHLNGIGTSIFASGDKFIGSFVNDVKNGVGEYYFASGDTLKGNFYDNQVNNGEYYYSNGNKIIGNFINNIPNGECDLYYTEENISMRFNGDFSDFKNAEGCVIKNSGFKEKAIIKDGKIIIITSDNKYVGEWICYKTENDGLIFALNRDLIVTYIFNFDGTGLVILPQNQGTREITWVDKGEYVEMNYNNKVIILNFNDGELIEEMDDKNKMIFNKK